MVLLEKNIIKQSEKTKDNVPLIGGLMTNLGVTKTEQKD